MKKNKEVVLMCILKSDEPCDPECSMYSQCWDADEMSRKIQNEPNR